MIIWIDLETTGLNTDEDLVLEVAAIATDDDFVEAGRFHAVTDAANHVPWRKLDPAVQKMHDESGLWMESLRSQLQTSAKDLAHGVGAVERMLAHFIRQLCPDANPTDDKSGPTLGGSTVGFDRAFLRRLMPRAHELLHYRSLDATSLNEVARRAWPSLYEGRPRVGAAAHRAMADVETSLAVARYYRDALSTRVPPEPSRLPEPYKAVEMSRGTGYVGNYVDGPAGHHLRDGYSGDALAAQLNRAYWLGRRDCADVTRAMVQGLRQVVDSAVGLGNLPAQIRALDLHVNGGG